MTLREEADQIIQKSIQAVLPDEAVARALSGRTFLQERFTWLPSARRGGRWVKQRPGFWATDWKPVWL